MAFAIGVPFSVELLVDFIHARHPCTRSRFSWAGSLSACLRGRNLCGTWSPTILRRSATWICCTHVPITTAAGARLVYDLRWHRPSTDHTYRFRPEAGLNG